MKAYVASGWFTPEQEIARLDILIACKKAEIEVYSPKDDGLFIKGVTDPKIVFDTNIAEICTCDFIIASTVGKDMGTLFECGVAYVVKKPIVYYWPGGKGPFNLMLSETARQVHTSYLDLYVCLSRISLNEEIRYVKYEGEIE